jgi:D-alanine transfer protein
MASDRGHEDYNFTMNYSAIQAYQFAFNNDISSKLKAKIAKRLLSFNQIYWDPVLTSLLIGVTNKSFGRTINYIANPLGHVILSFLEQLDNFNSYQLITKYNKQSYQPVRKASLDWQKLMANAEKDGQKGCQTNSFSIDDRIFRDNIQSNLKSYRNSRKKDKCSNLDQYQELQLILSVFKELKIKPLIVVQPMNGFWSDYTGLPKEVRKEYYAKVKLIIKEAGFGYIDFSDHEYDPYFFHDTKHIAWKGWVYIDQSMDQFYNQSLE